MSDQERWEELVKQSKRNEAIFITRFFGLLTVPACIVGLIFDKPSPMPVIFAFISLLISLTQIIKIHSLR